LPAAGAACCSCLLYLLPSGLIGYSAYAPSKFAVRGLAECLRNEVRAWAAQAAGRGNSTCTAVAAALPNYMQLMQLL
jgi:NAD(P)-dependent dehydrogenase (short-subunit alcohol dehydrogenase family)